MADVDMLPQPNYIVLAAGLQQVLNEFQLIPNIPPPGNDIHELTRLVNDLTTKLNNLVTKVDNTNTKIDNTNTKLDNANTKIDNANMKIDNANTKIDTVQRTVTGIEVAQRLLPMRLANSGAGRNAPLRGPHGILGQPDPRTHEELLVFTVAQCNAAATHLGLPNLAVNAGPPPTVNARCQQIADYLGVTLE